MAFWQYLAALSTSASAVARIRAPRSCNVVLTEDQDSPQLVREALCAANAEHGRKVHCCRAQVRRFVEICHEYKKDGPEFLKRADQQQVSLSTKSLCLMLHPDVEKSVHRLCEIARGLKIALTQDLIRERNLLVKEKLFAADDIADDTRKWLSTFSVSNRWCKQFLKLHSMKSVSL